MPFPYASSNMIFTEYRPLGLLRRVAPVRTDVSEERSYETSVLTRATRRNNPEDTILHSHRRENLKSYIAVFLS
jgi:hypothetical protein